MIDKFDVIVIGGGPAGCAAAIGLNKLGYRVVLCDQAKFPRDKVCGEFISPAADPLLSRLGVLDRVESLSPKRLKGVAISSYEGEELVIDYPRLPEMAAPPTSLSVPRYELDSILIEQVKRVGVEVREQSKITEFLFDEGNVVGVRGWDENKTSFVLHAPLVIDAGGRNSLSLRKFGLKKESKGKEKIALAAHWQGAKIADDYCYMHVSHPGYTGISSVGENRSNVVLVVNRNVMNGEKPDPFYRDTIMKNRLRQKILQNAECIESVRAVESLGFSVKPVPCGGLLLVGDAMGFIDPFTGEGIYLSLRSSEIAVEVAAQALKKSDLSLAALKAYEVKRKVEFDKKFLLSRILQKLIYNPFLCDRVVSSLRGNNDLAETLVGVIGDLTPAETVVSFKFLLQLMGAYSKETSVVKLVRGRV
ncbi:MAG: NAD(P)/FAD-dependent oxidoreductase [Nitrospina sp.]|jgi:flavin-dependent dehydrogenase|nr:NAD(P)/FAD-dependent oxidoreductase [Nitrospina sp.]